MYYRMTVLLTVLIFVASGSSILGSSHADGVEIGNRKQLFIDDHVVESTQGVTRRLNRLERHPGNPVLVGDRPWERWMISPNGRAVLFDRETGEFKMWYMASHPEEGAPGGFRYKVGYAVSQDGIEWEKPNLGQVDWEGSRDNNLIPRGVNWMRRANVIKDLRDPDPQRRFKMTYVDVFDGGAAITKGYSSDGVHWRLNGDGKPWFRRPHNGNLLGWDPRIERYVFYVRMRAAQNTVGRAVSPDFVTWSEPETVMAPGPAEPDLHFKGLAAFLYEDLYLGWLWVFERGAKEFVAAAAELAVSRDGIHWNRPFPGSFVLERGEDPAWDSRLSIPVAPVVHDQRIWCYYWGENMPYTMDAIRKVKDGWVQDGRRIQRATGLATLRLDGFVALSAKGDGSVTTKLLETPGGRLAINARVRGELRAEVLDENGKVMPGYGFQQCSPIRGDSLHHDVTWGSGADLVPRRKAGLRIRFHLRDTDLYAFQIRAD